MTKHVRILMVVVGLAMPLIACGDDSGGKSKQSGDGGAGNGGSSKVTPEDALAGKCDMMGSGTNDCTGVEEYTACVEDMCKPQDCTATVCKDYLDCVKGADDPCKPSGCTPSGDCQSCLMDVATCSLNKCFSLLKCKGSTGGETKAGGACDQLDTCCKTQPMEVQSLCMTAASAARAAGGDKICEQSKAAFCM
jgi:hypothetical protein